MEHNQEQINQDEIFNLLSHRRLIKLTIRRLVSDSWNIILNSNEFNNIINKIRRNYDINTQVNLIREIHKTLIRFRLNKPIDILLYKFNIDKDQFNKIESNIKYFNPYLRNQIIKEILDIPITNVDEIIQSWYTSQIDIKLDSSNDHYIGTTPIKSRKKKIIFQISKTFRQFESTPRFNWIENMNINRVIREYMETNDNIENLSPDQINNYVLNTLKYKTHKFYTIIQLNNRIDTWKIIMERKINLIIQNKSLKFINDHVKMKGCIFNNLYYYVNNNIKEKTFEQFICNNIKTYLSEYLGFQIPGTIKYVRKEIFGYYIVTLVPNKCDLIRSNFPKNKIKFKKKDFKITKEIIYNKYIINKIDDNDINYDDYNIDEQYMSIKEDLISICAQNEEEEEI